MPQKCPKSLCVVCGWVGVCVCKPNLEKDFCPNLDLDLDFVLGQAFQYFKNALKIRKAKGTVDS